MWPRATLRYIPASRPSSYLQANVAISPDMMYKPLQALCCVGMTSLKVTTQWYAQDDLLAIGLIDSCMLALLMASLLTESQNSFNSQICIHNCFRACRYH